MSKTACLTCDETTFDPKKAGLPMTLRARMTLVSLVCLALAGCGGEAGDAPRTQVAAKVNDREITVHQVNEIVAQARNVPEAQVPRLRRETLERLIDQELLVDKAVAAKLDRDPRVMTQIQAARRQILAQAYLESVGRQVPAPKPEEIAKFYGERPELFAERRVYRLREVAIAAAPEDRKGVSARVASARNLDEVVSWLGTRNIKHAGNAAVRAAEQLPLEMATRLAGVRDGSLIEVGSSAGITVIEVSALRKQPVTAEQAAPFIEQYLVNTRRREAAASEMKQLRTGARIEYVADYARPGTGDSKAAGSDGTTPVSGSVLDAGPVAKPIDAPAAQ